MSEQRKREAGYSLVGAINPRGRAPAVCVPAFSHRESNATYVQYIGMDETVADFEVLEGNEWEQVHQSFAAWVVAKGEPSVHWVAWTDDFSECSVGPIERIRSELLQGRWRIDTIDNPFERLDFAQLSGHKAWFSEEARHCEVSFADLDDLHQWLKETLLLSRVRFAVDTVLVEKSAPRSVRYRLSLAIRSEDLGNLNAAIDNLATAKSKGFVEQSDADRIRRLIDDDFICSYAFSRLRSIDTRDVVKERGPVSTQWWSKKLTASDVQRKKTGNQRGGISLTQAGRPIKPQTYFRHELFGDAEWASGRNHNGMPLDTAVVNFRTRVLDEDLGSLNFTITDAPNREAKQNNFTSTLHLGPLTHVFKERDFTGAWLTLERESDGGFALSISERPKRG
jgi:hypothetical protein